MNGIQQDERAREADHDGSVPFADRIDAGQLLAQRLKAFRGTNPLVLGIPRSAVPMAMVIAEALDGELDVVLVHKVGAPFQSEVAIGAVSEMGEVRLVPEAGRVGAYDAYVESEVRREIERLRRRRAAYTPVRPPVDPAGRIVIVVDDGVATGSTMLAALEVLRARKPARLVAAMAVGSREALARLREAADEVVCLATPARFHAVSEFFEDFREVTDEEVIAILTRAGGSVVTSGGK